MMTPMDKTWISAGLVVLALVEFFTAMHLFGAKPEAGKPKRFAKFALRVHRVAGYLFLVWMIWVIWIGVDLLGRLSAEGTGYALSGFQGHRFYHALIGVLMLLVLLLKILFVRVYTNYRMQARLLGFILTIGTLTAWIIAGWFYLIMMGETMAAG